MELYKRDFFISRIRAGYVPVTVDNKRMLVYQPDADVSLQASEIYMLEHERAVEEDLLNDDDILDLLIMYELWTDKNEDEYNNILPKHIEHWKVQLYQTILKSKTREKVRKYLQVAKDELERLHKIRHSYDHMTCEGYASYMKNMFIIAESARLDGKKVDWDKYDLTLVMHKYHAEMLGADDIRLLARTQPWSGMWSTFKANGRIFNSVDLSSEQQALISWSIMYDRIQESPDCPPDEVIEDDDMLDGWLIVQRNKREAEQKKQEVEGALSNKISGADEIYVVAETPEDAQKIDLLNDPHAKNVKRQRLNQVKTQGVVKQQQFKDVQQKRAVQLQQAYTKSVKGR